MKDRERASPFIRAVTPAAFIAMAVGSVVWFGLNLIDTIRQLITSTLIFSFNKGVYYMLGVGICFSVLAVVLVSEYWLDKTLSTYLNKVCTNLAIAAVALMFVLPHLVHYPLDHYLKKHGYEVCPEASRRWLHSRTIVYVSDRAACSGTVLKEE